VDEVEPAGTHARTVQYEFFREEPIILPNEHGEHDSFSAWAYADHIVADICKIL